MKTQSHSPAVRTLLVVEDEPDMRLLIKSHLRRDGRIQLVGEAVSAGEAFEIATEKSPELIILDHSIEGDVMGLAAAPRLKELAPHCRILLFTAFNLATSAAAEPAVDAFLSKSDMSKLLMTVQGLLDLPPV